MRRLRIFRAVWAGRPVDDPADAGAAAACATRVLQRFGRRSGARPFSRDFLLVVGLAAALILFTDWTLTLRLAMVLFACAGLVVFEIAFHAVISRILWRAARAEQANHALVVAAIASRYSSPTERPRRSNLRLVA
jgi:hypothetical protein